MNVAIILAGGVGNRMGTTTPKQYLKVRNKPIIAYTLEKFQYAANIDYIEVVCATNYVDYVKELGVKYTIDKLKKITIGGSFCQDSIRNGIYALKDELTDNDIVMLHMSVSPMISEATINKAIDVCKEKGNAFAAQPQLFCMCKKKNDEWSDENAFKEDFISLNMPWTITFGEILDMYKDAEAKGIGMNAKSYLPSLMFDYGKKVFLFPDNIDNRLKITTPEDLDLFEAMLMIKKRNQNKGV